MNILKQIGIVIVMMIALVIAALAIIIVWSTILIYSGIKWVVEYDGYSHADRPNTVRMPPIIQAPPVVQKKVDKLDKEIEKAFSIKPFPKPYAPSENPLYKKSDEEIQTEWAGKNPRAVAWLENQGIEFSKVTKPTTPFDREKVFAAVDESNVRMSKKRGKHRLRDKDTGRFIKSPITRYGVPTHERFGNQ